MRLLAHRMESFSKYTHLVIDEVHERSADGDILCLLAKKVEWCVHVTWFSLETCMQTIFYVLTLLVFFSTESRKKICRKDI